MVDSEFDKAIERRNTGSLKWDKYKNRDVIPMWVADMEFQAPSAVREELGRCIEHGVFGYAVAKDELYETIIAKLKKDYGWAIERSWIVWLPGLVPALNVACRCVGQDGDEVGSFVPVYPPFLFSTFNGGGSKISDRDSGQGVPCPYEGGRLMKSTAIITAIRPLSI